MRGYAEIVERICSAAPLGEAREAYDTDLLIGRPRKEACASARAGLAQGSR
jgi:hypothetical protein